MSPAEKNQHAAWSGLLRTSPVPELLAHAYNRGFTGSILFRAPDGQRSMVYCQDGGVFRASVGARDAQLEQTALAPVLPGDLRRFAAQHATSRGLSLLQAAAQLNLIPEASLIGAHDALVHSQMRVISKLNPQTHCEFFKGMNCFTTRPVASRPVEPLGLIFVCLLAEPATERCMRALDGTQDAPLVVTTESGHELSQLTGPLRAVVSRLQRSPDSLNQLKQRGVAPLNQLVAAVYALRLTRRLALQHDATADPRVTSSSGEHIALGPQDRFAQSVTPTPPAVRRSHSRQLAPSNDSYRTPAPPTVRPGRHASVGHDSHKAVTSSEKPAARVSSGSMPSGGRTLTEPTAETKCVEAWLKACDDPKLLQRASEIAERGLQLFPNNARIQFCRGALLRLQGELERARVHLKKAVELDPTDGQARAELRRVEEDIRAGAKKGGLFARFREPKIG